MTSWSSVRVRQAWRRPSAQATRPPLSVVVEKGPVVGAHILSGAVVDPVSLDRLIPDWREDPDGPLKTAVARDEFYVLGPSGGIRLPNWPMPRLMDNHGNFIGSLGAVIRWLGARGGARR